MDQQRIEPNLNERQQMGGGNAGTKTKPAPVRLGAGRPAVAEAWSGRAAAAAPLGRGRAVAGRAGQSSTSSGRTRRWGGGIRTCEA